jgi:HAMP domain-containing protein
MGKLLNLNSRVKIGVRIFSGFALVLALLVGVGALGYLGLTSTQTGLADYERVAGNTTGVLEIDRDFTELRRNLMAYANNADEKTLARIHELQKSVADEVKALAGRLIIPELKEMMTRVGELVDQVVANQNLAIEAETKRDKLNGEMIAWGEKLRETLTQIRSSALRDNDSPTATEAGIAQEVLVRAQLNANRYVAKPDPKWMAEVKDQFAALTPVSAISADKSVQQFAGFLPQYRKAFDGTAAAASEMSRLINEVDAKLAEDLVKQLDAVNDRQSHDLQQVKEQTNTSISSTIAQSMAVSGIAVMLGGALAWLIGRGISLPVNAMTTAMTTLAGGDVSVEIPARENTDEIGEMAKAVQVFKDTMVETEHLRAEQEEQKRAAEEQQRQAMLAMADSFEMAVGDIVRGVSSQATELQATAQSMSATAEETERQSTAVAAASEQASANVQTVASAAEELSSSIAEIGRQVASSSDITAGRSATRADQRADPGSGRGGAEHRRRRQADQRHRRPDQPAGVERDDRGGARGGRRQGVRGCRGGGEVAWPTRRPRRPRRSAPRSPRCRRRPRTRSTRCRRSADDRADQRDRDDDRLGGRGAGCGDAGDRAQRAAGRGRDDGGVDEHRRRDQGGERHRRGLDPGAGLSGRAGAAIRGAAQPGRRASSAISEPHKRRWRRQRPSRDIGARNQKPRKRICYTQSSTSPANPNWRQTDLPRAKIATSLAVEAPLANDRI